MMKLKHILFFVFMLFLLQTWSQPKKSTNNYVLVIQCGTANSVEELFASYSEQMYRKKINEALAKGANILQQGGSSIEAVEQVLMILENSPMFNAGKGSAFNYYGVNEMEACMMNGSNQQVGAVSGVTNIQNPIRAARLVLEKSDYTLLHGEGASVFSERYGSKLVNKSYFFTGERWDDLHRYKNAIKKKQKINIRDGAVGCVALDKKGNLAAGTSSGGLTNRSYHSIGATSIAGAATYANNMTCAVSCTGNENFMSRYTVAADLSALIEYKKFSLTKAADYLIKIKLKQAGVQGGLIALNRTGEIAIVHNQPIMMYAFIKADGQKEIVITKKIK